MMSMLSDNPSNSSTQGPTTATQNSSDAALCNEQQQRAFYMLFNQMSLIPAVLIIIFLLFMKKRAKFKRECCDSRPGIQIPVDFLGEEDNRFSYGIAYGGMAIAVTNIFSDSGAGVVFDVVGHPYIKVFQGIITVICIGSIYLPFFMCLSTDAKLLGAVFGFIYTLARTLGLTLIIIMCPLDTQSVFIYWPILANIPAVLCHLVLLIRYAVIFVKEVMDKCCRKKFACRDLLGDDCSFEVGQHYVNHVKTLLHGPPKACEQKWYIKGRNFIYTPDPHFKYSVTILSTVIVAAIIIYQLVMVGVGGVVGLFVAMRSYVIQNKVYYITTSGQEMYEHLVKFLDVLIVSFLVSILVGALYMYFQMYRMLVSHRNHVIKLIKGDRHFLPTTLSDPHILVGMSLRFAGYQVAHFIWGFLIVAFVLLTLTLFISAGILFLPMVFGNSLNKRIANVALALVPTVGMAVLVFIVQQILARYVFKDRSVTSKVVNIHNRRLFLLVSFFFFFFNILVGLLSCLLRILKGMILGILFIGRIDRPLIMKGFTFLDSAYNAYIGFLHLQVAHKHPVVRVFSHLLWSGMRRKKQHLPGSTIVDGFGENNDAASIERAELNNETNPSRPRVSASALNKWFIAVTVIRNPVLIYNRKGFLKHIILGIPNSPSMSSKNDSPESSPLQAKREESASYICSSAISTSNPENTEHQLLASGYSESNAKDASSNVPIRCIQGELVATITTQSHQDKLPKVDITPLPSNRLTISENGEAKTLKQETEDITIL